METEHKFVMRIDEGLFKEIRVYCIRKGISVNNFVNQAIKEKFNNDLIKEERAIKRDEEKRINFESILDKI